MSRIWVLVAGLVVALLLAGGMSAMPDQGWSSGGVEGTGGPSSEPAVETGPGPEMMGGPMMPGRFFGGPGDGKALVTFRGLEGFALQDDLAVAVRLHVEKAWPVAVTGVRDLLSTNKTLREIRELIMAEEASATYRGAMRMGDSIYRLLNIQVAPQDEDNSTLEADLAERSSRTDLVSEDVVGHLILQISERDQAISEGTLNMTGGQYTGKYRLLLDCPPRMQPHGMGPGMPCHMDGCGRRSPQEGAGPAPIKNQTG